MSNPKEKPKATTLRKGVVLSKDDFTDYAKDCLGIWDALTEGLPEGTDEVEVDVVRRAQ